MHKRARVPSSTGGPYLPALVLLFAGSGCAALIYQIVWLQLLQLIVGSSAVSLSVLLGAFMGGMCLGSVLLPHYVRADRHPLRVHAYLELGIALTGPCLTCCGTTKSRASRTGLPSMAPPTFPSSSNGSRDARRISGSPQAPGIPLSY